MFGDFITLTIDQIVNHATNLVIYNSFTSLLLSESDGGKENTV